MWRLHASRLLASTFPLAVISSTLPPLLLRTPRTAAVTMGPGMLHASPSGLCLPSVFHFHSSLIPSSTHSRISPSAFCIRSVTRYTLPLLSSHLRRLRSCALSHDPSVISPPPRLSSPPPLVSVSRNELTDELPRSAPLRRPSRLLLALSLLLFPSFSSLSIPSVYVSAVVASNHRASCG
ncbi:hypothetical protein OH76DRAFT_1213120 [Lentinus brumalis]|uniref:REJ domain-containing protein n=1 Tax=Lentinus brumalis TaxID=2498619 RepID=A0A371DLC7_9APHY|nr:hypothetical protein OH76DRAFT_1213120 [Polyporus brumalis]